MPSNVISTELKLMIGNCSVARKNCRRKSSRKTHYRKIAEEEEAAKPIKAWQKNIAEGSSCFSQLPPVLQQNVLCSRTSRHGREDQVNLYIRCGKVLSMSGGFK
jgi:hypothetical protein